MAEHAGGHDVLAARCGANPVKPEDCFAKRKGMYLLSCPFCGNTTAPLALDANELNPDEEPVCAPYWAVCCCVNEPSPVPLDNWSTGCGATGGYAKTKEWAMEKWNRRA